MSDRDLIRIRRSTTASPPPSLEFGELAFADASNTLYVGKANGEVYEFPFNGELASVLVSESEPAGSTGALWYRPSANDMRVWNGAWVPLNDDGHY